MLFHDDVKKERGFFLIRAENDPYWVDFLAPQNAKLSKLDDFLRDFWLECCGHMSLFKIGMQMYMNCDDNDDEYANMNVPLKSVLETGAKFNYEYDFGSTTYLNLKVLGDCTLYTKNEFIVCVQNKIPEWPCTACQKKASARCTYCNEDLCDGCVPQHRCVLEEGDDYMIAGSVNSPRMGVCGYEGR